MKPLPKIAIIGVGRWGKNIVRTILKMKSGCTLSAVAFSGSQQTTAWLNENAPDVKVMTVEEIMKDDLISAVIIATPASTHLEIATLAFKHGKHVFVEKPAGTSPTETKKIVEAAEKAGKILQVGYILLYHPALRKINDLLWERHELPKSLDIEWLRQGTFETTIEQNLLCHDISVACSLFNPEISIKIVGRSGNTVPGAADDLVTEFFQSQTPIGRSHINRVSNTKSKVTIVTGNNGSVFSWENDLLFEKTTGKAITIELPLVTPLELELNGFLCSIVTQKKPLSDGQIAIRVAEILREAGA